MDVKTERKLAQLARKELARLEPPARAEYDYEFEAECDDFYRSLNDD